MKPLTKKYLLFFLVAYFILRLPSLLAPFVMERGFDQLQKAAAARGFTLTKESLITNSLRSAIVNDMYISKNNSLYQKHFINKVSLNFLTFFPPLLQVESTFYEGNLNCSIRSDSLYHLIFSKTAKAFCDLNNLDLQKLPINQNINFLGKLTLSFESNIHPDPHVLESIAELRLSEGYLNISELIGSNLLKIPPISGGDLFLSLDSRKGIINIKEYAFKSNFGFVSGKGQLQADLNIQTVRSVDIIGSFTLSEEGRSALDPWIPLINDGKNISSNSGTFKLVGSPPNLKLNLESNS